MHIGKSDVDIKNPQEAGLFGVIVALGRIAAFLIVDLLGDSQDLFSVGIEKMRLRAELGASIRGVFAV